MVCTGSIKRRTLLREGIDKGRALVITTECKHGCGEGDIHCVMRVGPDAESSKDGNLPVGWLGVMKVILLCLRCLHPFLAGFGC